VFYDGSTKLGELTKAPFSFLWQYPSPGNHLVTAEVTDNLGAETKSSPKLLTVSGTEIPQDGNKPRFGIEPLEQGNARLTVSGSPGYYIISMSEDLRTWVDIYPVTIDASGSGSINDSTASTNQRLFFRVRREP
jgi:hypothetical protein